MCRGNAGVWLIVIPRSQRVAMTAQVPPPHSVIIREGG
jgi:hypothetical protein